MHFTILKVVCRYHLSSSRNLKANIGVFLKNAFVLGRSSVNMPIRGVVAAVRVVRNHPKITSGVFVLHMKQIVFIPLSLLFTSKVATELRIQNFYVFRMVIVFVLIFHQLLSFSSQQKSFNLFSLKYRFHW